MIKSKLFCLAFIIFLCCQFVNNAFAQSPECLWGKRAGGTDFEGAISVTNDASGNAIMVGYFLESSITFGNTTLHNAGGTDIFIVKYSPDGNILWARSAGGVESEIAEKVITDGFGNIFITGFYTSPSISFGGNSLRNTGIRNIFVVKYSPEGRVLWAKNSEGTGLDWGRSVSTDRSGNVYITGWFTSPEIQFGTSKLKNSGNNDVFLTKYNSEGKVLWAKAFGGSGLDNAFAADVDASGNIILGGYFNSPTLSFGSFTLKNKGGLDVFLTKIDQQGNVLWAKSMGESGDEVVNALSTDVAGNILVCGNFTTPSLILGTSTLTNTSSESDDIFLIKFAPDGHVLWANSAGGDKHNSAVSVSADSEKNILMTGYFKSSTISFGSTYFKNAGSDDIFIVKYDKDGKVIWAKTAGGPKGERANSGTTDKAGNIIIAGYFNSGTFDLGSTTLQNKNEGSSDVFIAKFGDNAEEIEKARKMEAAFEAKEKEKEAAAEKAKLIAEQKPEELKELKKISKAERQKLFEEARARSQNLDEKKRKEQFLSDLSKIYPEGYTEDYIEEKDSKVWRYIWKHDGTITVYEKRTWNWGGIFFFKDGYTSVTEHLFNMGIKDFPK